MSINAQNLAVEYLVNINTSNSITSTEIKYNLIMSGNESLYFNSTADISQFKNSPNAIEIKKEDGRRLVQLDDNSFVDIIQDQFYKSYVKNVLFYNDRLVNKKTIVTESLNIMKWNIVSGKDSLILGYKCQKAYTDFRGRRYEAFFSSTLYPNGGPWKFDGLPGLILSVRSTDNYFVIRPLKLILNYKVEKLSNPYLGEKGVLTWDQFVLQFEDKLKKILKQLQSDPDAGSGSIKITDRIEDLGIKDFSFN